MGLSKKGWLEYEVAEADAGLTVESIVREKLHVSGRMLQRLTRSKGVLLNRKPPFLKRVVKAGDKVAVRVQDQPGQDASPQQAAQRKQGKSVEAALPVEILYEDEHLLVANKPAGMMVHPVKQDQQGTLVHALAEYLREKGEPDRVHPVHRLDKETSGAILVGKTSYGHQLADRLLRDGSLHREYLAVVCGRLEEANGTISAPIGRDPRHPTRRKVTERGEEAVTHYELEAFSADTSLVRVWLETGRTHQIRVHFRHIGHPLAGDGMYGGRRDLLRRQALHASKLSFPHPITGQEIVCEAPLPDDMNELIKREYNLANR
ncbi:MULTISPECIES: RluA family pseudouridine synthase [Brevibacillus]|uniref:RluA family pseudouridine synthase n=1 Tax=Brevibacillus TaxID=55080 RepID=UPI0009DD5413|nr:RluA family pseudouridine synthase [Brevibacillus borstelensis]MBE5396181.1 RluA family pseudouridine synthase [Brevibacillus borstelensis]MCM3621438.1 RluA family pseudouridine synthase [Brevibacillus borstelensis]MED1742831.1 RluA family pseudouridine synthase [Brevibacillus borstelensis]MED1881590.1 RluA family pseudouridine synthase [Brevibacillus borstelensis]RNB64405.1 RluA family pseudouridine synthase [Brevibacillus borstelensis]